MLPAFLIVFLAGCRPETGEEVVIYTSQDQVYSESILRDFTAETGIRALVVHDSEAVKTVGLANRLLAESAHPRCDVFWSNEEMRTRQLVAKGVLEADGWVAFGHRSRRLVLNTNLVPATSAPADWIDLTNRMWRGKVAMAYPMFGTTATHFHALRQAWGPERWEAWCRALADNEPMVVDGNSVVVRMVGSGRASVGMTDSDDVAAGQREGLPLLALPLTRTSLLIPNTVALVRGRPHPEAAQRLADYLLEPRIAGRLVQAHALEGVEPHPPSAAVLNPDWDGLLRDLETTSKQLESLFLR